MRAPPTIATLFAATVWDLTHNFGHGFRTSASVVADVLRSLGLA